MASDALDSALAERLGSAPELPADTSPSAARAPRSAAGKGKPAAGRKAPGAAEIVSPLSQVLGLITLCLGLLLCGFNLEDPAVDAITMEAEESKAIAEPLANILSRQKWFSQYGRQLMNSQDAIALIFALILYAGRVYPVVYEKLGTRPRRERAAQQTPGIPPRPAPQSSPTSNGVFRGSLASGLQGLGGAYTAD